MTSDAPNNNDWLSNPVPPPKHALADLGQQLKAAVVAAEPKPKAKPKDGDPGPRSADRDASGGSAPPPRKSGRPKGEIWDGCPVKPLGLGGEVSWYLDRHGQLRGVDNHTAQKILHLFGDKIGALCLNFPTYDKSGDRRANRFDQTSASMAMIAACSERGLFNPDGAVRGVGAWSTDDGGLIYHAGASLITADGAQDPGEIDGKIYPAYPSIASPTLTAGKGDPAEDTLALLSTWTWARPDVDPMLTLGMVGCQMLGGALAWRPAFWFTGDKASGKSTLQDLIRWLHGDKGLIQSTDPTKSGITSRLGHSSLPVALDELEPGDEGSSKERDIITLARVASSGGTWLRGSADQKGASGNVYSTFMFSSILIPGTMGAADRSRLVTFNLFPPDKDAPKPVIDPRTWKLRGAALKRLLIDRWPTWAERLQLWRAALARHDLTGRNGDNWATVMAMADMAMHADNPAEDYLDSWARKIAFAARAETSEIGSNAEDMLQHLIGQPFDVFRRGELFNVAHWLMVAAELPGAPWEVVGGDAAAIPDPIMRQEFAKRANEKLAKAGLRVKGTGHEAELFVPNKPIPGLVKLFERSQWANGVWSQAARRVPGAKPVENPLRLAGQATRGVYIPLTSVAGMLSLPMDRAAPIAPAAADDFEDFA